MQGVVDASMGGGGPVGPQAWQDCNVNDLTDLKRYDPISGFPVYKALLCEVFRIDETRPIVVGDCSEELQSLVPMKGGLRMAVTKRRIYLDHNATTPLDPEVAKTVAECADLCFGNPSSIHEFGGEARFIVESARRQVAQLLNCTARRIVFTGGGSESDNLAIEGVAFARRGIGNHIITTAISILPSWKHASGWKRRVFRVTRLPVSGEGLIDPGDLEAALTKDTQLVSVMTANNETGAVQPISRTYSPCSRTWCPFPHRRSSGGG